MTYLESENGDELYCSKIICIARNYVDHIHELNNSQPKIPFYFIKPNTALTGNGKRVFLPEFSNNIHHECELGIVIGKDGKNIKKEHAFDYIYGYCVAIDLTARDIQDELKKNGYSWEIAKAFDQSCPVSKIRMKEKISNPQDLMIRLSVNNELRQQDKSSLMIHKIDDIISDISRYFTLCRGDLILTGTPKGVGKVKSGDILHAEIETIGQLHLEFV